MFPGENKELEIELIGFITFATFARCIPQKVKLLFTLRKHALCKIQQFFAAVKMTMFG